MPPVVGMRFGRYELLDKLGAGGMGEVYRARDLDLGRDVAVKFLPEPFAAIPDRLGRFAQEARAASSLNHPNIVTIHEIGETAGLPFTVMELVEGGRCAASSAPSSRSRPAGCSTSPASWPTGSPAPTPPASSTATSSPRT